MNITTLDELKKFVSSNGDITTVKSINISSRDITTVISLLSKIAISKNPNLEMHISYEYRDNDIYYVSYKDGNFNGLSFIDEETYCEDIDDLNYAYGNNRCIDILKSLSETYEIAKKMLK
jgi:hypothetical protein